MYTYCPPESGNIVPSSAKAKQAHMEINPPSTHTKRKSDGCGSGPAISFAVRKMDEPITPPPNNKTESSSVRPRTSVGRPSMVKAGGDATGVSTIPSLIRRRIRAECHSAGKSPRSNPHGSAGQKLRPHISDNREVRARPVAAHLKP